MKPPLQAWKGLVRWLHAKPGVAWQPWRLATPMRLVGVASRIKLFLLRLPKKE